jgi:hypothetical protein
MKAVEDLELTEREIGQDVVDEKRQDKIDKIIWARSSGQEKIK